VWRAPVGAEQIYRDIDAMKTLQLLNYALDDWHQAPAGLAEVMSAVTGEVIAQTGSDGLDFRAMLDHARNVGGPALRAMTFHERAWMLKDLANAVMARKEELYELSYSTGATRTDSWIDIEGGAGTLFSFSSKGRRELPNGRVLIDGAMEPLSKRGSFVGQHVFTPLQGVAVHINAFNFPVWGMLEKLGPTLLAGVPAVVKPGSSTGYLTELAVRIMIEADVLPKGALQLIMGSTGDLMDHLTCQDVVSFTGSAATAMKLQSHPVIARESVRFVAERDSLNASILGPDAGPGTPEFDLFVREVAREMTVKAGQKCTAIRRAMAPAQYLDAVQAALSERLARVRIGDPREEGVQMGPLASQSQLRSVREAVAELSKSARIVSGDPDASPVAGGGAFISPILLRSDDPWGSDAVHDVEAFGPVSTLMPYRDLDDAIALANRGMGSLALSLFTFDPKTAEDFVLGAGAYHGRMVILDRNSAKESTGHGSPLPVLVHGGPGRAGGGEEMGGVRGVKHYMQRTALQGGPETLSKIVGQWLPGADKVTGDVHPFRKRISELEIGTTLKTGSRIVTLDDIEHFAFFTGDTFYAHMDDEAARASPIFGGRVAHGYLILSFAAGLFVDPAPGPVLANTGLDTLRFLTPLYPGDAMRVELTVKSTSIRDAEKGEVRWAVEIFNQKDEIVATYELLTMNTP
jgi:oxepin-CoA hydrolase/3-oxo-5,6-dehydrosuberyl-CoA semialdehyde dehydrogenase